MVRRQKDSTLWQRLVMFLGKPLRRKRVERSSPPPSDHPISAVNAEKEAEIRKRLEGLGYIE